MRPLERSAVRKSWTTSRSPNTPPSHAQIGAEIRAWSLNVKRLQANRANQHGERHVSIIARRNFRRVEESEITSQAERVSISAVGAPEVSPAWKRWVQELLAAPSFRGAFPASCRFFCAEASCGDFMLKLGCCEEIPLVSDQLKWSGRGDLNSRPPAPKPAGLSLGSPSFSIGVLKTNELEKYLVVAPCTKMWLRMHGVPRIFPIANKERRQLRSYQNIESACTINSVPIGVEQVNEHYRIYSGAGFGCCESSQNNAPTCLSTMARRT
jgi:hypothetical protein